MANATNSTAGDIQLAGDLAGNNDATAPALTNTAVTPGAYSAATFTVDSKGRLTAASSATLSGDVTGTLDSTLLANTAVTPGSYTYTGLTVDSKGRITAASSGSTALTGDVTGTFGATVLTDTAVTPGSYTYTGLTVDSKGRITAASNGSSLILAGDVEGTIGATVLSNTAVTPGSYSGTNLTVDSKGRITAASNTTLAGDVTGPIGSNVLANTAVTPGSYTYSNLTVDSKGRITAASSATSTLAGDVTGSIGANVLANTAVTPGSYTNTSLTVDSKGRITAASTGSGVGDATYATKGILRVDDFTGLTLAAGVLSGTLASGSSTLGVVKSADTQHISITTGDIDVGPDIPLLGAVNEFYMAQHVTQRNLTSATTVAVDGSLSNVYSLYLSHNATLLNPTNLGTGKYAFKIQNSASFTLAFDTKYRFASGADTAIALGADKISVLTCVCDGTDLYCSLAKDFA